MPQTITRRTRNLFIALTPAILGGLVIVLAGIVISGWVFHKEFLVAPLPDSPSTQFNSALGILACGLALVLLSAKARPNVATVPAVLVFLLGASTLMEFVLGVNLGIDQLFFKSWQGGSRPGRMAASTAACFVLAGLAVWLTARSNSNSRRGGVLAVALNSGILAISLAALTGFWTGLEAGYRVGEIERMAVITALSFALFSCGLIVWGTQSLEHKLSLHPASVLMALTGFAVTFLLWRALIIDQSTSRIRSCEAVTVQIAYRLTDVTGDLSGAVKRLAARWPAERPDRGHVWSLDAGAYARDYAGLSLLEWIDPTGKVARTFPEGTLLNKPANIEALRAAVVAESLAAGQVRFSRPVAAPSGSQWMLFAAPGSHGSATLVALDLKTWLAEAFQNDFSGYFLKISVQGQPVFARLPARAGFKPYFVERKLELAGQGWTIELWPASELLSTFESALPDGLLAVGLLSSILLAAITHFRRLTSTQNRRLKHEIVEREATERELQRAKMAAEEASRIKSEFLACMSHEIRTPMNSLLGMADLLAETRLTTEQRQYVSSFQSAGNSLLSLINDILDLSKVESGKFELASVPFSVIEVVQQTASIIGMRAKAKGLDFSFAISSDVPRYVMGDPDRIRQVLINLLGNAVKFTDSGSVRLTIMKDSKSPDEIRFAVADTGIGIPEANRNEIFDLFTQGDSSITRRYGGTGLGLAISRGTGQKNGRRDFGGQ